MAIDCISLRCLKTQQGYIMQLILVQRTVKTGPPGAAKLQFCLFVAILMKPFLINTT